MSQDHLARRGYEAERRRHRENLARAVDEVQRGAASLASRVDRDEGNLADEASRLLAAAADALRYAGALDAAEQLSFTVNDL